MNPEEINPNEEILVDATLDTNDKLDELNASNEVQAEGILEVNNELKELNSSVDLIMEQIEKKKTGISVMVEGGETVTVEGPKGDKGDKGEVGMMGPKGDRGEKGEKGDRGDKGDKGDKGDAGPMGIQGFTGPKGAKGDKGDRGPAGPRGKDGKDGKDLLTEELNNFKKEIENKFDITSGAISRVSSKTVSLVELDDVDLSGLTVSNGKYLLGSGGSGGAVDSVNGQTGVVVLDADDISDTSTTHKFVTSADITKLSNLSGTNTGDQTLPTRDSLGLDTDDSVTFQSLTLGSATASRIASFDANKNIVSLATATYPDLTELSYVKGLTSAVQTQLNGKQATLVSATNIKTINGNSLLGSGDLTISGSSQWTTSGSDIYYNTGKVFIGTTSSSAKVAIEGNLYPLLRLYNTGTGSATNDFAGLQIGNPSRTYQVVIGAPAFTALANKFYIYDEVAPAVRFLIDTNGWTAIGGNNSTPTAQLDVRATDNGGVAAYFKSEAGTNPNTKILIDSPTGYHSSIYFRENGSDSFALISNTSLTLGNRLADTFELYSFTSNDAIIRVHQSAGNSLNIDSAGVVSFPNNIKLTQTVTTESLTSDRSVTVVINGTTYKLLAKA